MILAQDGADVLIGNPSIIVTKPNSVKNISMTLVDIAGIEGRSYSAGFGSYAITTQANNPSQEYTKYSNVSSIVIETDYVNSWNTSFQRSFQQQGLNINYTATLTSSKLIIDIYQDALAGYNYDLYLKEVDIITEIGYGFSNS